MIDPFPPAFLELLRQVLRRAPALRGGRDREARSRRRALAQSGTFSEHRRYAVGDDPRHVDWNVFARTDHLFIKVLEDEDRRTLTLLVDRTASMATGEPQRLVGALRLAALLGGLALARLDGVQVVLGRGEVLALRGAGAIQRLLDTLAGVGPAAQDPVDLARAPVERGWQGRIIWLSDFAEPEAFVSALGLLRSRGRRVVGCLPEQASDHVPTLAGHVRVVDPESGEELVMEVDAPLRAAMAAELEQLRRQQDAVFARVDAPLVRFPLPAEGDFHLSSWLSRPWIYRI